MPIQVGVMCEKCGTVYLIAHPDALKRISRNPQSEASGMYTLTCPFPCGTIRSFHKNEMKPYSISDHSRERGFAKKSDYHEQLPVSYRNKPLKA
jgi:hypothetical protein